jgi:two-component system LytT family response regulator
VIKAIIVDDEKKSRATLLNLLNDYCPMVKVTDSCDSVDSAISAIERKTPDVVFLDIEMPLHNGFNLLERVKDPEFAVVFVTAYNEYAIQAIKLNAMDYLLKPVDVTELMLAVEKIKKREKAVPAPDYTALIEMLKSKSAKIAVPTFEGLQMVNAGDIIKCVADDTYTVLHLVNGKKLMVSKLLKEYEELLEPFNFFRIHNSYLINLVHVTKYVKGDGGYVIMSDGESCEVSRRKKNELLSKLSLIQI